MNTREKTLVVALAAILFFGVVVIGGYYWFYVPLTDYNKRIATLQDDREKSQDEWNTFLHERKKLEFAKLKSLPANPGDAQSEYIIRYLEPLCERSGLSDVTITHTPVTEIKPVSAIPGIKKVGHQLMTFTVRARGELGQLVKVMEVLQNTPYEHRIKSLTLDRSESSKEANPKLGILMTIETLLVAKTNSKPGIPPGYDPKFLLGDHVAARTGSTPVGWGLLATALTIKQMWPTPEGRVYDDIGRKNIFVGAIPKQPDPPAAVAEEKKAPDNIPAYVRLVQTVPAQKEAYLLNLFSRKEEIKLIADPRSGYEVQPISDWETSYTACVLKTLRVDPRLVYFQVRDQVYRIELGQTLDDAMKYPLSIEQLDVLDLEADRVWAKEQMKDKTDKKGKTTTKKKGTTKG